MSDVDVVKKTVEAFNAGQMNAVVENFGPHLAPHVRKGSAKQLPGFSDVNYTITNIDEVGNEVHFTFTATGTNSGKFLGLAATQKKVQWEGRAVATVVNGKIDTLHVIEDDLSKAAKLGLGNQISTVTGDWTTTALGITVNLHLTQTGQSVKGTAKTNLSGQTFNVTGSAKYPKVHLAAQLDPVHQITFDGTFENAKSIKGTFRIGSDSGAATLRRT